ncbi:MAG TPA: hypothetical protein VLF20_00695 [Patescibacteria group bacterium]|nr:hypothetical protein [Patescibacteria group bacterium]
MERRGRKQQEIKISGRLPSPGEIGRMSNGELRVWQTKLAGSRGKGGRGGHERGQTVNAIAKELASRKRRV